MTNPPPDKDDIYYQWGDDSPPWLHRRVKRKEVILPGDVARVIEANPDLVPDDFIRDLVVRGLTGQLPAPPGRKRNRFHAGRDYYAATMFADLHPRIVARRKVARLKGIKKGGSDHSPAELVHALIGRHFGKYFGSAMSREAVRNLLSSLKNRRN